MSTKSPKISIIVPVYKVEQYLPKCIDSILSQTYQNWELLLVDDGSPDNSGKICDEYADKDLRIRVFHKENGGASSARNLGIERACGEWISFVDSDDFLDDIFFETLLDNSDDYDCILSGYTRVFKNGEIDIKKCNEIICNDTFEIGCKLNIIDRSELLNSQCCKLLKREIIMNNSIRFMEGVSVSEDMLFCFNYFSHVRSVFCKDYSGYYYRVYSEDSLSKRIHPYNDYFYAMDRLFLYRVSFIDIFSIHDYEYKRYIYNQVFLCYIWSIRALFKLSLKKRLSAYQNLYKYVPLTDSLEYIEDCNLKTMILKKCIQFKSYILFETFRLIYSVLKK